MNKKSGVELLREACRRNTHSRLLEKYIESCHPSEEEDRFSLSGKQSQRSSSPKSKEGRFPNVAGFCRFLGIGTEDMTAIAESYPEAVAYIYAALEDEALNSPISATLLTAYLKRRLGYDRAFDTKDRPSGDGIPVIRFEHDIFEDGG